MRSIRNIRVNLYRRMPHSVKVYEGKRDLLQGKQAEMNRHVTQVMFCALDCCDETIAILKGQW